MIHGNWVPSPSLSLYIIAAGVTKMNKLWSLVLSSLVGPSVGWSTLQSNYLERDKYDNRGINRGSRSPSKGVTLLRQPLAHTWLRVRIIFKNDWCLDSVPRDSENWYGTHNLGIRIFLNLLDDFIVLPSGDTDHIYCKTGASTREEPWGSYPCYLYPTTNTWQ